MIPFVPNLWFYSGMAWPWYLDKLALPAFFILLGALVGAIVGFLSGRVKDFLDAKKTKSAFLKGISFELGALEEQLNASLQETHQSLNRMQTQGGAAPILVGVLRTTVFSSQLGRLRDLNDSILMEIVKLYSDLGMVEGLLNQQNKCGNELLRVPSGSQTHAQLSEAMVSILRVLSEHLTGFLSRISVLRSKLP